MTLSVCRITRETPKAFQVLLAGDNPRFLWLPKAAVEYAGNYRGGDWDVTLKIQSWFEDEAQKKLDGKEQ